MKTSMIQQDIEFGSLQIGSKFYDYYYSGDYCIKVSDDTASSVENPFVYCIAPKSIVRTVPQEV